MSTATMFRQAADMMNAAGFHLGAEEESFLNTAASWPNVWAEATSTLYTSKLLERSNRKLAEANDRQAKTMTRLTWAIVIFAAVEAIATAVSAIEALAN